MANRKGEKQSSLINDYTVCIATRAGAGPAATKEPALQVMMVGGPGTICLQDEASLRNLRDAITWVLGETPDLLQQPGPARGGALPAGWRISAASSAEIRFTHEDGRNAHLCGIDRTNSTRLFLDAAYRMMKD